MGYVELIYAIQNKMTYGKVKNAAGVFRRGQPGERDGGGGRSGEDHAGRFPGVHHQCSRQGAYPISSFTWLLIPEKIADPAKKKAITDFLNWMLKDGQTMTAALITLHCPRKWSPKR